MIVIGVDPHKQTHTAAAVDRQTGELLGELTVRTGEEGHARLLEWARALGGERCFALEDCRQVSCRLERFLIGRGERVVRVPPKLMAGAPARGPQQGQVGLDRRAGGRACGDPRAGSA
jgi:transposase